MICSSDVMSPRDMAEIAQQEQLAIVRSSRELQKEETIAEQVARISPVEEIFLCFGQEEFFEGNLAVDDESFDANDLF